MSETNLFLQSFLLVHLNYLHLTYYKFTVFYTSGRNEAIPSL